MKNLIRKYLQKIFHIPKPSALPMRFFDNEEDAYCWEDWKKDSEIKYPIRYFLSETLPSWLAVHIFMPIEEFIYWIKSHTIRRYHILDLRQPETNEFGNIDHYRWGWADECSQMLYACFNILVKFVEHKNNSSYHYHISEAGIKSLKEEIDQSDGDEKIMYEMQLERTVEELVLYDYWTKDRKAKAKEVSEALTNWHDNRSEDRKNKNSERWDSLQKLQQEFDDEEVNMTIRLMKIRQSLWT